ncbi:MAG: thiamine biosynthesis protein ThiS [Acidimicrobiaceae bacterium]|nr:thiamine biosynthesis protein ThiS [Acidimicrobiaceae bacterium]
MSAGQEVLLNGQPRALAPGATVATVVSELLSNTAGCAVAVNGEVVPRGQWVDTELAAGDRLEVLTAAPGG